MLSHSGLDKLSRRTAGGLRDNQRQSEACSRLLETLGQNVSLHRHPWSCAVVGTAHGSRGCKARRCILVGPPSTVGVIDRQRLRPTMAAIEKDSMTRMAVLLDIFGTFLDDEADMHLTTWIRFLVTPFVFVLAASVGLAQQEGQQASAENARRIEVIQGEGHPWRVVDTIFRQPEFEGQAVAACVIGEVHPASERFYVRLGNMGQEAAAGTPSWDVGRHTGFRPTSGESLVLYQHGPQQSGEGTAVQVRGREIGIWIDSDHPRPRIGALLPVCPAYWWWNLERAPWPFREADRELSFSFDLKVPTAERQGQAEVYICAHFLFRDQRSNRQFWFGASLFDLRGAERFPDTVHVDNWEGGTGLPILFSALNQRSAWLHPGPGSAQLTDRTFDDYRKFDFRVGATELRAAIVAMRKRLPKLADASEDPRDYQLVHFNVNPEVYAPEGSRGRLGLAMRDIRVVLLAP